MGVSNGEGDAEMCYTVGGVERARAKR